MLKFYFDSITTTKVLCNLVKREINCLKFSNKSNSDAGIVGVKVVAIFSHLLLQ